MRTSVEIPEALLARVRKTMARRRTTLRALITEGLARVVEEDEAPRPAKPRRAVFSGPVGLAEPLRPADLPDVLRRLRHAGRDAE